MGFRRRRPSLPLSTLQLYHSFPCPPQLVEPGKFLRFPPSRHSSRRASGHHSAVLTAVPTELLFSPEIFAIVFCRRGSLQLGGPVPHSTSLSSTERILSLDSRTSLRGIERNPCSSPRDTTRLLYFPCFVRPRSATTLI